ncbi:hypothetical protein LTR10_004304 [Elasticomyces elasticus]|nr:hypothetical protein LTR10_004304 [Elasticomyces elasticus]KAK4976624.1 hypothetical protein LTR42_002667 [Elasticomyces elasticus]
MKFSTIALVCTMARFATAEWPHNFRRGFGTESLHTTGESIASIGKTMFKFNATEAEENISRIKNSLEKVAPFICEGKVSPFTEYCEKAAVQHGNRLRKMIEAFEITVESNRGLWEANSTIGDNFGKVSLNFEKVSFGRLKELEAQQLEATEVAYNLVAEMHAEMHANASELEACRFEDVEDAKERCSKARPLTKDEL